MDNKTYKNLSTYELEKIFVDACSKDLALVRYLLTEPELNNRVKAHAMDSFGLRNAACNNKIEIIRYLLTSSEISEHAKIHDYNDGALNIACSSKNLDVVKYLLTSKELKEKAWIHGVVSDLLLEHPINVKHLDQPFISSCYGGNVDIIKYLLESPELSEHCSIYAQKNLGFRNVCKYGHLEAVRYLLKFPGFNESEFYLKSLYEGVITSFHNKQFHVTDHLLYSVNVHISENGIYNINGIHEVLKDFPDEALNLVSLIEKRNNYLNLLSLNPEKNYKKQHKI